MTPIELLKEYDVSLKTFNEFISKRLSSFKVVKSVRDEFLDAQGVFQEEDAFNAVAYLSIVMVTASKTKLNIPGFLRTMLPRDRQKLQEYVFFQSVFFTKNATIFEKITGSSMSSPSFQFNEQVSRNILDNDVFGTYARACIKLSEIDQYELIDMDLETFKQNHNGVIQYITELSDEELKGGN